MKEIAESASERRHRWIDQLGDEDLAFLKRFLLASGSLKGLAEAYGVSYPTIRLRLDRLIAKIEVFDDQQIVSAFERVARAKFAEGAIDAATLRVLLTAHQQELEARHAANDTAD